MIGMIRIANDFSFEKYNVQELLSKYENDVIILRLDNTTSLSLKKIEQLKKLVGSDRLRIRVEGGYKGKDIYYNHDPYYFGNEATTYTLSEIKDIINELENIETGLDPNYDDLQKLLYFIGEIKNRVIFNPSVAARKKGPNPKEDQSLKSIVNGVGVCAGYALILKELCDRNNIKCDYVVGKTSTGVGHAWNIVTINGKKIPVDSTWNAEIYNYGRTLTFADSANVNIFIKKHIPAEHEEIQDYGKELVSIDGRIIRRINSYVNRNIKYEENIYRCKRIDGSEFVVTQLSEEVKDGKYVYRYLYQDILSNGKLGPYYILNSNFNLSRVICDLRKNEKDENSNKLNYLACNILFSKKNIKMAIDRGDFFLGNIEEKKSKDKENETKDDKKDYKVTLDLDFVKKIKSVQRNFVRSDGTSFIIQKWDFNKSGINRYIIYENIIENGEIKKVSKNTIFTEMDLLSTDNQLVPDLLLSRKRIDEKSKTTNGYMGYIDGKNKVSSKKMADYFVNDISKKMRLKDSDFVSYFKEITFNEMKRLVRTYSFSGNIFNGKLVNRVTGREVSDSETILKASFAYIWLNVAGNKFLFNEEIRGYTYAFNESSGRVFEMVSKLITKSMNRDGNIDPVLIYMMAEDLPEKYKYTLNIISNLFSNTQYTSIINQLFRLQNPSSVTKENQNIQTFGIFEPNYRAYSLASKRREEEDLKEIFELSLDKNNQLQVRKMTK